MTTAEVQAAVAASRAAQGLPRTVTDTATVTRIAALLAVTTTNAPHRRRAGAS